MGRPRKKPQPSVEVWLREIAAQLIDMSNALHRLESRLDGVRNEVVGAIVDVRNQDFSRMSIADPRETAKPQYKAWSGLLKTTYADRAKKLYSENYDKVKWNGKT